jgi:hypothetical protein
MNAERASRSGRKRFEAALWAKRNRVEGVVLPAG